MLDIIKNYFWVFFISMLPIIELRGAIPVGIATGLPVIPVFVVAIAGNLLPVPFLLFFGKKLLLILAEWKYIGKFFKRILERAERRSDKIGKYQFAGLMLFVGIPLPGTGAWTGSIIATLLGMRTKNSFLSIALGVLIAGVVMSLASAGLLGIFNMLFSY